MDVTKPYKFMRFGAMDVTEPYNIIGFAAMDVTKPYKFIGFAARSPSCKTSEHDGAEHRRCFGPQGPRAIVKACSVVGAPP